MKDFRSLHVWQKSMILARLVYKVTKNLPTDEKFGLTSQLRKCAVSVPSNIAESSKRNTDKDFHQFLRIASGSAAELETQLILASDIFHLDVVDTIATLKEVQKMLESFMKKL